MTHKDYKIDYHVLDETESFEYAPGTRTVITNWNPDLVVKVGWTRAIDQVIFHWESHYGEVLAIEDMFITVGGTTTEVLIEVSDRGKH